MRKERENWIHFAIKIALVYHLKWYFLDDLCMCSYSLFSGFCSHFFIGSFCIFEFQILAYFGATLAWRTFSCQTKREIETFLWLCVFCSSLSFCRCGSISICVCVQLKRLWNIFLDWAIFFCWRFIKLLYSFGHILSQNVCELASL